MLNSRTSTKMSSHAVAKVITARPYDPEVHGQFVTVTDRLGNIVDERRFSFWPETAGAFKAADPPPILPSASHSLSVTALHLAQRTLPVSSRPSKAHSTRPASLHRTGTRMLLSRTIFHGILMRMRSRRHSAAGQYRNMQHCWR